MESFDDEQSAIREQADKIAASGVLGRSNSYLNLLEYLIASSTADRIPKEHEIAVEVFNRDADFDPGQDSLVRVYAHHLRQKLATYYAAEGQLEKYRLSVPRGEYRVALTEVDPKPTAPDAAEPQESSPKPHARRHLIKATLAVACLVAGGVLGWFLHPANDAAVAAPSAITQSPVWRPILDDTIPVVVVVGDYYIYGAVDEAGSIDHLVRNFFVNSAGDLDHLMMMRPELANHFINLDLTYLPRGAAYALGNVLQLLFTAGKSVRVVTMSEFTAADLRHNHVIYVGYVSGIGMLYDMAFEQSSLQVGLTYDELIEKKTGKVYYSDAGMPSRDRQFHDYGLLSTFAGPGGTQIMLITGTRDAGLMQTAFAVTDPEHLREIEKAMPQPAPGQPPSFELLYQVAGLDRTNLDAVIVHTAARAPLSDSTSLPAARGPAPAN